jgi:LPXTG-site transpeptidase (sortase) family protein
MAALHAPITQPPKRFSFLSVLQHPGLYIAVAVGLLGFFLWWLIFIIGPVIGIEMKYRLTSFGRDVFGTTEVAKIFFPHWKVDLRGYDSEHNKNGITIPKIFVDEPVVYNVDPNNATAYNAALKQGIAHASGTAFPDNGQLGYYFAHSSTPEFRNQYNAIFYLLGKLKAGDSVFLWHDGKRFEYEVAWTLETTPDNVSFLHESYDKETIVLQTCWPAGTTKGRLLVFAQRVDHEP